DVVEGRAEVLEVFRAGADGARETMDQLNGQVGLAELSFVHGRAQVRGDVVAAELDHVRGLVGTDVAKTLTDLVGAPLDTLTDGLLALVPAVLHRTEALVDPAFDGIAQVPQRPHQPVPPPCSPACCWAAWAAWACSSGEGPNVASSIAWYFSSPAP